MEIPERLWRFSMSDAQDKLAARFDLPNEEWMQDWEYIVSDFARIDEFMAAYSSGELSDDEKFSLMELIIDSFWISGGIETNRSLWIQVLGFIENNIELHFYSVCYWASLDHQRDELELAFDAAPFMRAILNRHRTRFDFPPHDV